MTRGTIRHPGICAALDIGEVIDEIGLFRWSDLDRMIDAATSVMPRR